MSKKLTPWFPGDVKPARSGVYETDSMRNGTPTFQKWNGLYWSYCSGSLRGAVNPSPAPTSAYQNPKWRGLAKKP